MEKGKMSMKKFSLKIAVACMFLTLGTTACNDMLEEVNYGNPTMEEMMSDPAKVALVVDQAYAELKFVHDHWGYWGVNLLTSDEGMCPTREGGDWNDGGYWRNLNTHNWNKMADAFENVWKNTVSGAVLCNKVIANLNEYNPEGKDAKIVEMEVLRSYYYYLLFDCFGRIPYQEDFNAHTDPLMEPFCVWAHLVACLERNAPKLPDGGTADTYGRVTKAMAYTLLARLYLNAPSYKTYSLGYATDFIDQLKNDPASTAVLSQLATDVPAFTPIATEADFYTNCCRCCEQVFSISNFSLSNNFLSNFAISNEGSKENIFVIVEDGRANFDVRYNGSMMNKLRINMLTFHYKHQDSWNMIEKPWNGFCARPSFIRKYGKNSWAAESSKWYDFNADVRGPGTEWDKGTTATNKWGWFVGPIYDAAGKKVLQEGGEDIMITAQVIGADGQEAKFSLPAYVTRASGARLWKYEVDKNAQYAWCENDFVLLRLADVYWMNEEAILRGAIGGAHHWDQINILMARAFPYSGSTDADHINEFKANYGDPTTWTLKDFCNERGREFAWENVRRRDLIRFGYYNSKEYVDYLENGRPERNWFPIPYNILQTALRDANGNAIWTQNYGYE